MNKKQTTLSVLIEIRDLLKSTISNSQSIVNNDYLTLTFPDKTAKELVEECGNKLGSGKLLYNTSWYENEKFYTKEKCRVRTCKVSKELIGKGKNWKECVALAKEQNGEMLNFAEIIFFIQEYYKQTNTYPWKLDWSWTSTHSSCGLLVGVGYCDADGVSVGRADPRRSGSSLGVCFSSSEILN